MAFEIKGNKKLIVGVGSALVDMLARENDDFLEAIGAAKGGMTLVEREAIDEMVSKTTNRPSVVPGGSACNTAIGAGILGGPARFVGKRGDDRIGEIFETELVKNNVTPRLKKTATPTGRVLSVITPDAQRTMFTHLGAAAEMRPEDITAESFEDAAVVHVEGYLLFNRDLMHAVLKTAKNAGAKISLDLASFNVVEESKDLLDNIVAEYIDILIANEDEAQAFTGYSDEARALKVLSENAEIAVLKIGPRGSVISGYGETVTVAPMGDGSAVDTTGAGDLWAAGFLFGMVNGYGFEKSGALGSACGYEVCQVVGAKIPEEGWQRIKKQLGQ